MKARARRIPRPSPPLPGVIAAQDGESLVLSGDSDFLVNLFFSGSLNLSTVALIAFCNVCTGILQDGGTGGGITAATCINGTVTAATKAVVEAAGTRLARWLVPRAAAMAIRLVRSGSSA